MIEIIQDEQLQYHIILRGMVPCGSNMFTTHFRIQPLKVVSESVASVISKSQIAPRSLETFLRKALHSLTTSKCLIGRSQRWIGGLGWIRMD